MADSTEIDEDLIAFLRADAQLAAAAPGGVFLGEAPEDASEPFVIVMLQASVDHRVLEGRFAEECHYLVKAVAKGTSGAVVKTAAQRIDALLDGGQTITVTGFRTMACFRAFRVAYPERDGKQVWQHRGGIYQFFAGVAA